MSEPNRPSLTQAFRDGRRSHADVPFTAPCPRRYRVPLPFCQLTFHSGEPLDGRAASLGQCQDALDRLESEASAT